MSTLKVDNIRHNSATSDAITMASDGTCTAKVTNPLTNRRLNYNGAMLVNQRGNTTNTGSFSYYYGPDRYYSQGNGNANGQWDIGQSTDVPDGYGFKYSLSYDCTATTSDANRYLMTIYRMEGYDSQVFNYGTANAKTATLSFWIKCSKAGNFQVNFENEQNPDQGYQTQQTINSPNTWEKKVVTVPGDTTKAFTFTNVKAMCFDIVYSAYGNYANATPSAAWSALANGQRGTHCNMDLFDSTSNYVRITGVQFELGDHATDFEHIPYTDELQRCKRYYQKYSSLTCGYGSANGYARSTHILSPEMRATPSRTVTIVPGEAGSLNSSTGDSKHLEVTWQSLSGVQTGDFDAILEAEI